MDRYTEALEILHHVNERANELVAGLRPPVKSKYIGSTTSVEEDKEAVRPVEIVLKPYVKSHYIDMEMQALLPEVSDQIRFIPSIQVKHSMYAFLEEYEKLVKHEKELEEDRKGTLVGLHQDATVLHEWIQTNVALPAWEYLLDEVGDPGLHKKLDAGDTRLRGYTRVEKEMLSITKMIKALKIAIDDGHLKRKEIVDNIKTEKDTRSARKPTDICHEQIHKLKPGELKHLDKNDQAIRVQLAVEDVATVEMSLAGMQGEVEWYGREYKRLLTVIGERRKVLENHGGLQMIKEKKDNEELARATMKRDMEGYINGFVKNYQALATFRNTIKNDRDKALNNLRIKSNSIEGTPTQAMADLVKVLEVAGFDQLGKLKSNVLKGASLNEKEEEVISRLGDCVAEVFKMKERFTTLATGVKNATLVIDKIVTTDATKGAGKLPKTTGDTYLNDIQKILTQHTKTLTTVMEDAVGSVRQRNRIVASSFDAELCLLFGMWETEAIRYDLLHEYAYKDIKNSPSASALVEKGSAPSITNRKGSNMSQNKYEDEEGFFCSKLPKLTFSSGQVSCSITSEESMLSSASENGHSNIDTSQEKVKLPAIDRKRRVPSQPTLDDLLATPPSPDMPHPHQVTPPIAPRGHC